MSVYFSICKRVKVVCLVASMTMLFACSDVDKKVVNTEVNVTEKDIEIHSEQVNNLKQAQPLIVYKTSTCGCCQDWVDHLTKNNLSSEVINQERLSAFKQQHGIAPRYQSCHTAVSQRGYIFEGHVPAKYIQQFLAESHNDDVLGLAVPAMPIGSPGMEMGDKFMPYKVLLLTKDGSSHVYAKINTYQEQF